MKNVCFFNSLNFWGGGEKLHLEYAIAFKKRGFNVCIMAHKNGPLWEAAVKENIPAYPVTVKTLSFLNPIALSALKKQYQQLEIDTVIFSTSQDMKFGGIAAKQAGVSRIVYLRGLAVPIKNSPINRYLFSNVLTHIVANSKATASLVTKHLKSAVDPAKLGVIYHGIEIDELEKTTSVLPEINRNKHGVVLGNAGRLTKQKGQFYLLEIAEKLMADGIDFSLFIAGTGELENELQTAIKQKQLEQNVFLLGFVRDMKAFMQSIDIFLLSSAWEGFGYVLVEAMINEKPVVAFNISSNPEIVANKKTGYLVSYPDTGAFAQKTKTLIQDKDLREGMGRQARQHVIDHFEIEERVDEFVSFLNR